MLNSKTRQFVLVRAGFLCEYCLSPMSCSYQPFVSEHIIPICKNGTDDLDNLASSCGGCNGHKYNKTTALDSITGVIVPLYNPRTMTWQDHFKWSSDFLKIMGNTDIGRATIETLYLNRDGVKNTRRLLLLDGTHPAQR